MSQSGSIRLGNKRAGSKSKPAPGEVAVDIDRQHPVLGNPHILHNHRDDRERAQVIAAHRVDFEADLLRNGPISQALTQLARRVLKGERLILMCWCAPTKPCHGAHYLTQIRKLIREQAPTHPAGQDPTTQPVPEQRLLF